LAAYYKGKAEGDNERGQEFWKKISGFLGLAGEDPISWTRIAQTQRGA
jgi:hypothetical protein